MKKLKNSKMLKNFLIMLLYTLSIEVIFRLASKIDIFDTSLIRVILGYSIISLVISFILSWFNKTISNVIMLVLAFLFAVYAFLQMGFNNFIGVYMSFNTTSQLGAVVDYVREFIASFLPQYYLVFIPFVLILTIYSVLSITKLPEVNIKKFTLKKRTRYEYPIRVLSTLVILIVLSLGYYESLKVKFMQNELQTVSNYELFKNPNVPSIAVNEFGVLGFGVLDVKTAIVEPEEVIDFAIEEGTDKVTSRAIDDSAWEKANSEEKNKTMLNISNYLINQPIIDYNDYTGLFEGKNLIVIMMESVNEIFINPEYYPNFYKIYTEGWSFKNHYSPRNSCSTGNNEFSAMTGLYSIYNNCTANKYKENTYSDSIFNLFNAKGYETISMHDYTEAYYYRRTIHKNLGSSKYYGVQDLNIPYYNEYRNWASDEDFAKAAMDIMLTRDNDKPFMLWMTSVSSHQPYVVPSVEGDKYTYLFEDTDYPEDLKRYMSKLKTLDNALGILLERLEDAGILDDTVIALFGDHYPYGLKNATINYVLDYDLDDYEVERTPFVIYNSEMEPRVYEQYTSYINLTPTMANLFNLEYDPRLYMGRDLFSDDYESLVVYADGSWKNEFAYYDASDGKIEYFTDKEYTVDEIKNINNKINLKTSMSSLIIKNNYFNYMDNKLAKAKEELAQSNNQILADAEMED